MMHARSSRRRSSDRDFEEENGESLSLLEIFLSTLTDRIARSALLRVRRGAEDAVTWTVRQLVLGWVTAAILMAGIALLLFAGVKGLEALQCPPWLAYLSAGTLAVLIAGTLWRVVLTPGDEEDGD